MYTKPPRQGIIAVKKEIVSYMEKEYKEACMELLEQINDDKFLKQIYTLLIIHFNKTR